MDDASVDDSAEVAACYPVHYVRNESNLGAAANFNKGVRMARGEYIAILGADNRLRPDYLAKTATVLDADPQIAIVYTHMALFGPFAEQVYKSQRAWQTGQQGDFWLWAVPEFNPKRLFLGNYIHGSALFRKTAFEQVGGYRQLNRAEDWDLWKRIVKYGWRAKLVPAYLLEYRQHSLSQRNIKGRSPVISLLKRVAKQVLFKLGIWR